MDERPRRKKSSVHLRRNQLFYSWAEIHVSSTDKQNTSNKQSLRKLGLPRASSQSGIRAYLAGTWLFLRTLLHSSCILEKWRTQGCMFLFWGEREGEQTEGGARFTHRPILQIGPDWASSDPEKQPKQEEGCEFMTKQNTQSQRDTLLGGFG